MIRLPAKPSDYWIRRAEEIIFSTYGDRVSVRRKGKDLAKFGLNATMASSSTIYEVMQFPSGGGPTLTMLSSNLIDSVVSSSGSNTQDVTIEGHYDDGSGNLVFHSQQATLDGQNEVTLSQPLRDATRIVVNEGESALAASSTVYVYDNTGVADPSTTSGVPDQPDQVHVLMTDTYNRSQKASTTISAQDYWIVGGVRVGISKNNAGVAVEARPQMSLYGGRFDDMMSPIQIHSTGSTSFRIARERPPLIVPPNHDFRVLAQGASNNVTVTAEAWGVLALVV